MADAEKQRRLMQKIAATTGWVCHYCGDAMLSYQEIQQRYVADQDYDERSQTWVGGLVSLPPGVFYPTLDHKVPRSQGGPTVPENLVLCCHTCNATKGAHYTYDEFRALRRGPRTTEQEGSL